MNMMKIILSALVLVTTALPIPVNALDDDDAPDPKRIELALAELSAAFKARDLEGRVAAIQKHADVHDARVAESIAKGLKDKNLTVADASIEALRWFDHPAAVKALEKEYGRNKKLKEDPNRHLALVLAIGQHGSTTSIPILTDASQTDTTAKIIQARIMSLGNVRSVDSIDELLDMITRFGSGRRGGGQKHMADFTTSLTVLTGQEIGRSPDVWAKWWRENKKTFRMSPEPVLPKGMQKRWERYWRLDEKKKADGDERQRRADDDDA
jgi:hypothetical protein